MLDDVGLRAAVRSPVKTSPRAPRAMRRATTATTTTMTPATTVKTRCGGGVARTDLSGADEGAEACDDGNEEDGDDCTNGCVIATCGDGVLRITWKKAPRAMTCDDGNRVDEDECLNACTIARCGDGVVGSRRAEGFEACDDGNESRPTPASTTAPRRRAAYLQQGLKAATTATWTQGRLRRICRLESCGNGRVDAGEECDDGNQDNTGACLDTTRRCRDGVEREASMTGTKALNHVMMATDQHRRTNECQDTPAAWVTRGASSGAENIGVRRRQPRQHRRVPRHLPLGALRRRC